MKKIVLTFFVVFLWSFLGMAGEKILRLKNAENDLCENLNQWILPSFSKATGYDLRTNDCRVTKKGWFGSHFTVAFVYSFESCNDLYYRNVPLFENPFDEPPFGRYYYESREILMALGFDLTYVKTSPNFGKGERIMVSIPRCLE